MFIYKKNIYIHVYTLHAPRTTQLVCSCTFGPPWSRDTSSNNWAETRHFVQYCMCVQWRLKSVTISQADQKFRCPSEDALDSWLPTDCPVKTLISPNWYACWCESFAERTCKVGGKNVIFVVIQIGNQWASLIRKCQIYHNPYSALAKLSTLYAR